MKVLTILMLLASFTFAGININGNVKDLNGKAIKNAHAHIVALGGDIYDPTKTVEIAKDGTFKFEMDDGYYTVYITAADHAGFSIPVISDKKNMDVQLAIQLKGNTYFDSFDDVKIVGDWNKFSRSKANKMIKQSDGTYTFEIKSKAEKVAYQLVNVENTGHTVNGTMHDMLEYDGGGDYKSIVKTNNGMAKIIFDPKKLNRNENQNLPTAQANDNSLNQIITIENTFDKAYQKYRSDRSSYAEKNKSADGFQHDFTEIGSFLEDKMQNNNNLIQRFAAIKYVSIMNYGYDKSDDKKVVNILKITDPLWALNSYAVTDFYLKAYGEEKANKLIAENFDSIPAKTVRARILALQGLKAKENDQMEKVAEIHKKLTTEYADQKDLRWYVAQFDPTKAINKGKAVPDFEVKLIHSENIVSKQSMLGKYYLIDFWAVWCGPCRAEMPNMHQVYQEFKGSNFEILSLSFDPKVDAVDKYRKETWPMPWLHTFVEGGFNNDLAKRFEVLGIPKPVLVNPQGIIVATDTELRGENLKKTLNKFLNTAM